MTDLYGRIREDLLRLPEAAAWPELLELADDLGGGADDLPFWEYPLVSCQAMGGDPAAALPASGAVFCLVAAIRLVDDILDADEVAPFRTLGEGPVANLALAFQAAAGRLVRGDDSAAREATVQAELAAISLRTALGQHLDACADPVSGLTRREEDYWRVAAAKTPPLVEGALALGGLYAGTGSETLEGLRELGRWLGLMIQVSDDLADAMEGTPSPDWRRPRASLPLLYALEADHSERGRFERLVAKIESPGALEEAQRILVRCGAVSYCAMHLERLHRELDGALSALALVDRSPLEALLLRQRGPLERLYRIAGGEGPTALRGH